MKVTPTQLRANLYKILDEVIETQKPIEIHRKGQIIKLIIEPKRSKRNLSNLQPHPGTISTDPESLVSIDWSKNWNKGTDV